MQIVRVGEDDWEAVRDVRLAALRDSPDSFGSTWGREERFAQAHWRMRLRGTPTWLAVDQAGTAWGIVSLIQEPGSPVDDRHVVSLWVLEGNTAAVDLYVRAGFRRTGVRQQLPRDARLVEERYELALE